MRDCDYSVPFQPTVVLIPGAHGPFRGHELYNGGDRPNIELVAFCKYRTDCPFCPSLLVGPNFKH